jgi:hypothetical protein
MIHDAMTSQPKQKQITFTQQQNFAVFTLLFAQSFQD